MTKIELIDVTKSFRLRQSILGNLVNAVSNLSFSVEEGELLVLLGPSGCGKSTTLRLIAGLEVCDHGQILFDGQPPQRAPHKRNLAYVFQEPALFPHLSVGENIAFGLGSNRLSSNQDAGVFDVLRRLFRPTQWSKVRSLRNEVFPKKASPVGDEPKDSAGRGMETRVRLAAERLGIENLLSRRPHQLSGGERQRVALGRAIVRKPAAFLLDEPLSSVDQWQRTLLRTELRTIQKQTGTSAVYVTHDLAEAFAVADRLAVMNQGKILQIGNPEEILNRPSSMFVAQFMGELPINWVKVTCEAFRMIPEEGKARRNKPEGSLDVNYEKRGQEIQCLVTQSQTNDPMPPMSFRLTQLRDIQWVQASLARGGFWMGIRPSAVAITRVDPSETDRQTYRQLNRSDAELTEVNRQTDVNLWATLIEKRLDGSGEVLKFQLDRNLQTHVDWESNSKRDWIPGRCIPSQAGFDDRTGSGFASNGTAERTRWVDRTTWVERNTWLVHRPTYTGQANAADDYDKSGTGAKSSTPVVGETIGLKFDSTQLHFFDLQSGQNLRKDLDETK